MRSKPARALAAPSGGLAKRFRVCQTSSDRMVGISPTVKHVCESLHSVRADFGIEGLVAGSFSAVVGGRDDQSCVIEAP